MSILKLTVVEVVLYSQQIQLLDIEYRYIGGKLLQFQKFKINFEHKFQKCNEFMKFMTIFSF